MNLKLSVPEKLKGELPIPERVPSKDQVTIHKMLDPVPAIHDNKTRTNCGPFIRKRHLNDFPLLPIYNNYQSTGVLFSDLDPVPMIV